MAAKQPARVVLQLVSGKKMGCDYVFLGNIPEVKGKFRGEIRREVLWKGYTRLAQCLRLATPLSAMALDRSSLMIPKGHAGKDALGPLLLRELPHHPSCVA